MKPIYAVVRNDADLDADQLVLMGAVGITEPTHIPDNCKVVQIRPDQAPSSVIAQALEALDEFCQMVGYNKVVNLQVSRFTSTQIVCINTDNSDEYRFMLSNGLAVGRGFYLDIPSAKKLKRINAANKEKNDRSDVRALADEIRKNASTLENPGELRDGLIKLMQARGMSMPPEFLK